MGACLFRGKVNVNKKDAAVISQPEFQQDDGSSSSIAVSKIESLDSDLIEVITKTTPSLRNPKNDDPNDYWDFTSKTNFQREVDDWTPPSPELSIKNYLSSILEPSLTNSTTLPASVYGRRDFNTENSYQSNNSDSCLATGDNSKTCLSINNDQSSDSDSPSFGESDTFSYDGLNMRSSNRHDIGIELLKAQIEHGADPNRITTHGDRSALMFSVMANDLNFTKKLVRLGVDLNERNHLGETALSLAREAQNEEIVNYLLSQGAFDKVAK